MTRNPSILSLGSINVDFQVRVERWPAAGETLMASDFLVVGGGKAANVAYLACRLGARASLVGRVGDDELAARALAPLREQGVALDHTHPVTGQATGVALIAVHPDGNKTILLAANANDAWSLREDGDDGDDDRVAAAVDAAAPGSVLVVDLEIPLPIVRRAVHTARRRGLAVVLDPSPAGRMEAELLAAVDYLVPNHHEAEQITGVAVRDQDSAMAAAEQLVARGVGTALVKLADGGCAVVGPDTRAHVPSSQPAAVDKTGAGDAFAGALGVAVLEGRSPLEAARFAVACADIAVTRYGSQASYPTRAELEP